ncbi:hypothetical protein BN159_3307 [Streptomyces davaonensis JCM 4913]|uniref:Uncharacterized protein n=1 Tax=Streptomyces davaonensis (strain DSM 101723 / JCM 4913 / KCC S-0913 / 768) TaxID=1214101 RepID=K4QUL1_STRDJ|nr:hypothetical protein BN159_3307 [Streptomyces davaonensis JCM 4913]
MVGVLFAVAWLVLPGMTSGAEAPVAGGGDGPVAGAAAQDAPEDSSAGDLVLPLVAAVAAVAVAGYAYVRRSRRARTRTTPGGEPVPDAGPAIGELDARAQALLVEADDWVRTSREELSFADGRPGMEAAARALREAEAELASAFRMRQRFDDGLPEDDAGRQQVLAGIVGRCEEAGRRLDAEAAGFDQLRGLEGDPGGALEAAEGRFRELTARTGGAGATLVELDKKYGPAATAPVAGYVEQAKDRLVFATSRLNEARQGADLDATERAIGRLRAAEAAIARAEILVHGVERLAEDLAAAAALVPAALTGGEAEIAGARERAGAGGVPGGPPDVRMGHADGVLADVREELARGPYDPVEALRRIVRGVVPVADGRAGVVSAAAWLVARASSAAAEDHIAAHRSAIGYAPRTRLAEARRLLTSTPGLTDLLTTDALARRARELAEQDIRLRGAEPEPETSPSFGGPRTCGRRG